MTIPSQPQLHLDLPRQKTSLLDAQSVRSWWNAVHYESACGVPYRASHGHRALDRRQNSGYARPVKSTTVPVMLPGLSCATALATMSTTTHPHLNRIAPLHIPHATM